MQREINLNLVETENKTRTNSNAASYAYYWLLQTIKVFRRDLEIIAIVLPPVYDKG